MQKGIAVCILMSGGKFKVSMNGAPGKAEYDSLVDAKLKVFDLIESGKAAAYLDKRQRKYPEKSP